MSETIHTYTKIPPGVESYRNNMTTQFLFLCSLPLQSPAVGLPSPDIHTPYPPRAQGSRALMLGPKLAQSFLHTTASLLQDMLLEPSNSLPFPWSCLLFVSWALPCPAAPSGGQHFCSPFLWGKGEILYTKH